MLTLPLPQTDVLRVLQGRHTRIVVRVLNVLLVVWIASLIANLTWGVLSSGEDSEPAVVATASTTPVPADQDRQLINQLPGWHLMGAAARGSAPVATSVPVDAPETNLKLVLKGVFSSDDQDNARAIIADPRGEEEQYSVGDKLPGNAALSEVHPYKVILKRGGRYETLKMPRDTKSSSVVSSKPASRRTAPQRSSSSPQERLQNIRQNLRKRPGDLYDLVKATPKNDADGNTIGYELGPGRDPDLFAEAGLQQGDVAIQINDIKLNTPANSARAFKSVQSGDTVSVTVLRNGQQQTLSLSLPE